MSIAPAASFTQVVVNSLVVSSCSASSDCRVRSSSTNRTRLAPLIGFSLLYHRRQRGLYRAARLCQLVDDIEVMPLRRCDASHPCTTLGTGCHEIVLLAMIGCRLVGAYGADQRHQRAAPLRQDHLRAVADRRHVGDRKSTRLNSSH